MTQHHLTRISGCLTGIRLSGSPQMEKYKDGIAIARKEREPEGRFKGRYFILMGPTGSGKSSFIEAIASKSRREPLGIAKDQLDSVTQEAHVYEIKNLTADDSSVIYIIDTPGLADPRISEMQVLDNMTYWRDRCQDIGYGRILYFHPIGDIRMPASRKRCLAMIQSFWGNRLCARAMLVTSMWDRLPDRSRGAAEERFAKLSTSYWGDWITSGSVASKFENTFESAMQILDTMCDTRTSREHPIVKGLGSSDTELMSVYEALFDRISYLEQHRDMLKEDFRQSDVQSQPDLVGVLTSDLTKTNLLLHQFRTQMEDFLIRTGLSKSPSLANRKLELEDTLRSLTAEDGEWNAQTVAPTMLVATSGQSSASSSAGLDSVVAPSALSGETSAQQPLFPAFQTSSTTITLPLSVEVRQVERNSSPGPSTL
ncbi:hypothetical protein BJ165DRAFT_1615456 [Panaeolus papilionaceus]|nr:hypothetical protein BJ165DRAFT_1615456 [Panaeolus papilionaceus]